VPTKAKRCPHCGDFQKADARRLMIYLGVAGIIGILLLVGLGLYLTPPVVDTGNQVDNPPAAPAPKPAKKPPLD
jgi:hypothetical protein